VSSVSAGYLQTCVILRVSYKVRCWGVGAKPDPNVMFSKISVGIAGGCGIQFGTSNLLCWGSSARRAKAAPAISSGIVSLSYGVLNGCVVQRSALTPVCWGYNSDGQTSVPSNSRHMWGISLGTAHACGITYDQGQTIHCWGSNLYGQTDYPRGLTQVRSVTSGWVHSCAIKHDYTAVCWGNTTYGRVTGAGSAGKINSPISFSTSWPAVSYTVTCGSKGCRKGIRNSGSFINKLAVWRGVHNASALPLGSPSGSFARFSKVRVTGKPDKNMSFAYSWLITKNAKKNSWAVQYALMLS
jgi:hypothetical protein